MTEPTETVPGEPEPAGCPQRAPSTEPATPAGRAAGRPEASESESEAKTDAPTLGRIADFLAAHSTLTLATVDAVGLPYATAVFYAHDARFNLYFLSEERTQHGQNLAASSAVAATVQSDGQDWQSIQGLQVRGLATRVPIRELAHAAAVYGRKYAFVGALLASGKGPEVLAGPLARARFYVLRPGWLRLTDNTVHFGYKLEIELNASTSEV